MNDKFTGSKLNNRMLVMMGLLIALQVVFTRFLSVNTMYLRIGFSFLPLAACSILYGPVWGGVAGAAADIIGFMMYPSGPFFPGFTINALISGWAYGFFAYKKEPGLLKALMPVIIDCILVNLILGTFWLAILYDKGFLVLLPPRIIKNILAIPIQTGMIYFLWKQIIAPYKAGRFGHGI